MSSEDPLSFIDDVHLREAVRCIAGIRSRTDNIPLEDVINDIARTAQDTGFAFFDRDDLALCGFGADEVDRVTAEDPNISLVDNDLQIQIPRPTIREQRRIRREQRRKKIEDSIAAANEGIAEIGTEARETVIRARAAEPGKKRKEVKQGARKVRQTVIDTREELRQKRQQRFIPSPIKPPRKRVPVFPAAETPPEGAPFAFVNNEELRQIILCILGKRFAVESPRQSFDQFVMENDEIAENSGSFITEVDEWLGCASNEQLRKFELLKLLQIVEGPRSGEFKTIIIPTKLPRDVIIVPGSVGESIRNWLLLNGEGTANEFWSFVWQRVRPDSSYAAVVRDFHIMEEIGLLEKTTLKTYRLFDKDHHGSDAAIKYRIVPGREADPAFRSSQQILYPASRPGGRRYQKLKEAGLVQFGRNPMFA